MKNMSTYNKDISRWLSSPEENKRFRTSAEENKRFRTSAEENKRFRTSAEENKRFRTSAEENADFNTAPKRHIKDAQGTHERLTAIEGPTSQSYDVEALPIDRTRQTLQQPFVAASQMRYSPSFLAPTNVNLHLIDRLTSRLPTSELYRAPQYYDTQKTLQVINKTSEFFVNEYSKFTREYLKMMFNIWSLTGIGLERLLQAILNGNSQGYVKSNNLQVKNSNDQIFWEYENNYTSYIGHDAVSLFAFLTNTTYLRALVLIFEHLDAHEYENSFAAPNKKSFWEVEEHPLCHVRLQDCEEYFFSIFQATCYNTASGMGIPSSLHFSFSLGNGDLVCLPFTLWKSTKTGKLRWFQKSAPNPEMMAIESKTESTHDLSHLIRRPGQRNERSHDVRQVFLEPIIKAGTETWIYGPEKSFKSFFARTLAHALANGGELWGRFDAPKRLRVFYFDFELLDDEFEKYIELELNGLGYANGQQFTSLHARDPDNPSWTIDFSDPSWKTVLEKEIEKSDVIIFDPYYKMLENQSESFNIFDFMLRWKQKGKAFIVVDHANGEGELQGTRDKRRNTDLLINISRIPDGTVQVSIPIARYLAPEDCKPLHLKPNFEDDKFFFSLCETKDEPLTVSGERKRIMLAHILKNQHKLKPKGDLDELFGWGGSTIYEWLKVADMGNWTEQEAKQYATYGAMPLEQLKTEAMRLKKQP